MESCHGGSQILEIFSRKGIVVQQMQNPLKLKLTMMYTMQGLQKMESLASISLWEKISYLGIVRSKMWLQRLVQNLNIWPKPILQ